MEIVDFYPKAKIEYINKTYRLIENLAYKIYTTKILSLKDSLIAIGYESIHKIIRSFYFLVHQLYFYRLYFHQIGLKQWHFYTFYS